MNNEMRRRRIFCYLAAILTALLLVVVAWLLKDEQPALTSDLFLDDPTVSRALFPHFRGAEENADYLPSPLHVTSGAAGAADPQETVEMSALLERVDAQWKNRGRK